VLEGLLLLLFVIFAPLLARVASRIRSHVDQLERVATTDELTGLPNRLALRRAGDKLLASGGSGVLVLVDLDGFSEINDCLGVDRGDVLLADVANRLGGAFRDFELVARLGEDEFGFLFRGGGREAVEVLSERVQYALAAPFSSGDVPVAVSVSIGAALLPEHGPEFAIALRRAGAALSIAKAEGESDVQIYDPAQDTSDVSRLAFAGELREALEGGQLLLHYQPQADLATQQIRGVEALLRWRHPRRGLLPALEFISYAERSGLAKELRHFVLESSAGQWRDWHALGIDLELAVNLSPVDLLDVSLPAHVEELLGRHEIPPWNLILEITERTLSGDERRTRQVIERLAGIGVRLAIDDFGTGYSSLASLRRFAVDQVKLDRSLLAGVPGDAGAEAIVRGSVEIAHGVGATVVAEGIETAAQWRFAATIGCDVAQGHLIGKPVPADELVAVLDVPRLTRLSLAQ
jgi:diguanylate cyclase (GGDEF)-like protein